MSLSLLLVMLAAAAAPGAAGSAPSPSAPAVARSWNFDGARVDYPAPGFAYERTGSGRMGVWVVTNLTDAPSRPYVLAQVDADPQDYRYPVAVADDPVPQDLKVAVKCRIVSGEVQQSCGVVFRYTDANNYYVARASVFQANLRLYSLKEGGLHPIAVSPAKVTAGGWNDLRVEAKGDHLRVSWNGKDLIDTRDSTIPTGTKAGVWTESDSVVYFDDLSATPLP